jgi:potassium-transporting ATPase potassium-binding subunit
MMPADSWLLLAAYLAVLALTVKPLGLYLANVMQGESRVVLIGKPVERAIFKLAGVDTEAEMSWKQYALSVLLISALGVIVVYALQRVQLLMPFNPQQMANVSADSAFNTAVSFVTNTNWQGYAGESTMSYLTQMLALTVQNFLSAATAIAVVFALMRGFARHSSVTLGHFWVDLYRAVVYVLLPLSFIFAIFLMSQGVIQNLRGSQTVNTIEATTYDKPILNAAGDPEKDAKGNVITKAETDQYADHCDGSCGLTRSD